MKPQVKIRVWVWVRVGQDKARQRPCICGSEDLFIFDLRVPRLKSGGAPIVSVKSLEPRRGLLAAGRGTEFVRSFFRGDNLGSCLNIWA